MFPNHLASNILKIAKILHLHSEPQVNQNRATPWTRIKFKSNKIKNQENIVVGGQSRQANTRDELFLCSPQPQQTLTRVKPSRKHRLRTFTFCRANGAQKWNKKITRGGDWFFCCVSFCRKRVKNGLNWVDWMSWMCWIEENSGEWICR
jgi:hypothetical protein